MRHFGFGALLAAMPLAILGCGSDGVDGGAQRATAAGDAVTVSARALAA